MNIGSATNSVFFPIHLLLTVKAFRFFLAISDAKESNFSFTLTQINCVLVEYRVRQLFTSNN